MPILGDYVVHRRTFAAAGGGAVIGLAWPLMGIGAPFLPQTKEVIR